MAGFFMQEALMTRFYDHHSDVPEGEWRWPTSRPAEIACRGTGKLLIHEPALDTLQALRDRLGKPLIVTSGYRSPEHNEAVDGAPHSKHMEGTAFDISMANHDPVAFEAAAREVGFLGFGFYPRSNFMHIDLGPARQWGERFPVRATAIRRGDAARARGAGGKPDAARHRGGGGGDGRCRRDRGGAGGAGRDPGRRSAAGAVSR